MTQEQKTGEACKWALEYLTSNNDSKMISHQKIIETAYSEVHKITTSKNVFYLKQTPKDLYFESNIIKYLHEQRCQNIPTIISENNQLNCFLMQSCGDMTLRQLFKKKVDSKLLSAGILHYTQIQRTLEDKLPQLLTLNTPDWRLKNVSLLYRQLIEQEELLISDGLTKREITKLNNSYETYATLCESLSQYDIPETITHCDFQDNNMIINQKTRDISIIDWGETVITHPFFSLNTCLWNITYFHQITPSDKIYETLQRQCVARWLDLHKETDLLDALNIAHKLNGIFAALSYKRMYDATMNLPKTVQQEHPGSIAGCLRSFISHC